MNNKNIWRTAFLPSSLVGLILILVLSFTRHKSGFWGALLGSATVLVFFSIHLFVERISRNLDPIATMALAMFSYFAKVLLILLIDPILLSGNLTILACSAKACNIL